MSSTDRIPVDIQGTADAIGIVEIALGTKYAVPVAVAHDALHRWYRDGWGTSPALLDIQDRYLGRFDDMEGLTRRIAEHGQAEPVDFDRWPFNAIDWSVASRHANESILRGLVVEVGDHQWFNRAGIAQR